MFNDCSSLKTLDLTSFNADKASVYKMFVGCKKLSKCKCSDVKIKEDYVNCICFWKKAGDLMILLLNISEEINYYIKNK